MKLLALLPISIFLIMPTHASRFESSISWVQLGNGSAVIEYRSDYNDDIKFLRASIEHSKSGQQRLYFTDYSFDNNPCKYESKVADSITMIFNGQAVKMSRWCTKSADSSDYYFGLTPETERGRNYVVNLFKIATSPIEIQLNNETLYFPVTGFTKAWNSAGGNAI